MQTVTFLVEKTGTGFSAYSAEFGILSTGKTLKQVFSEAQSGLTEQCEYLGENPADYTIKFDYDLPTYFEIHRLNVDAVAAQMGMNASLMSQYINRKKVPSPKQKARIREGIKEYARTLSNFDFA